MYGGFFEIKDLAAAVNPRDGLSRTSNHFSKPSRFPRPVNARLYRGLFQQITKNILIVRCLLKLHDFFTRLTQRRTFLARKSKLHRRWLLCIKSCRAGYYFFSFKFFSREKDAFRLLLDVSSQRTAINVIINEIIK